MDSLLLKQGQGSPGVATPVAAQAVSACARFARHLKAAASERVVAAGWCATSAGHAPRELLQHTPSQALLLGGCMLAFMAGGGLTRRQGDALLVQPLHRANVAVCGAAGVVSGQVQQQALVVEVPRRPVEAAEPDRAVHLSEKGARCCALGTEARNRVERMQRVPRGGEGPGADAATSSACPRPAREARSLARTHVCLLPYHGTARRMHACTHSRLQQQRRGEGVPAHLDTTRCMTGRTHLRGDEELVAADGHARECRKRGRLGQAQHAVRHPRA